MRNGRFLGFFCGFCSNFVIDFLAFRLEFLVSIGSRISLASGVSPGNHGVSRECGLGSSCFSMSELGLHGD